MPVHNELLARLQPTSRWLDAAWVEVVTLLRQAQPDPSHDLTHLCRVWSNARRIAVVEGALGPMWEAIAASVIFHDAVNLPKNHPERTTASVASAQVAARFLTGRNDFPQDLILTVVSAIETHSFSRGTLPQNLVGQIVCDADRLDAIGAIGIARTFSVGGQLGSPLFHPLDPFCSNRPPDDASFAVDHFFGKLLGLAEGMHTKTGQRLAQQRHDYMRGFLKQLSHELLAEDAAAPIN